MFDIGFAELIVIAIVGLLVIGPERLPSAIRTGALWVNRLRRGFNEIKMEVQQELHNDSVLQDLKATGDQIKEEAAGLSDNIKKTIPPLGEDNTDEETPKDKLGGA